MATSQARQNYHSDCEAGVNKQINMELYASYVYQSMAWYFDRDDVFQAWYFDRDDVAFKGFHGYFKKASEEEREHAEKFMKFQNQRGGRIVLQPINKPERDEWGTPLEAMETALGLEKTVNQALLELHDLAHSKHDGQMADFLESEFLTEQVEAIKEISDHITGLKRCGPGLGEYMYDKEQFEE